MDGHVETDIDSFSGFASAPVVRARAPQVNVEGGYDEHGEIYFPENRDDVEPHEENVDLDVAVMDGEITLEDSQELSFGSSSDNLLEGIEENTEGNMFEDDYGDYIDEINDLI